MRNEPGLVLAEFLVAARDKGGGRGLFEWFSVVYLFLLTY